MKFDSIAIGGSMAGLSAALRLAEAGQKTLLMASGQSALHFSSGSIDLLESEGDPRAALPAFMAAHPDHPSSGDACDTNLYGQAHVSPAHQLSHNRCLA